MITMDLKLFEMVNERIENNEHIEISMDNGTNRIMSIIMPYMIEVENGIYIEGENYILTISDEKDYKISYNQQAEEFIIKQENTTFYLS
jgi:hypothetical protein